MKKLMIAAAVAFAAVASQGAAINWATSAAQKGILADTLSAGLAGETHYNAGGVNAKTQFTGTTLATIVLTGADWTESKDVTVTWGGTGKATATNINFDNIVLEATAKECSYEITLYGAVKDGKGVEWDLTGDKITGTFKYSSAGSTLTSGVASGWTTAAAVPEPTSGLLLLLGVAGLALRRRRA